MARGPGETAPKVPRTRGNQEKHNHVNTYIFISIHTATLYSTPKLSPRSLAGVVVLARLPTGLGRDLILTRPFVSGREGRVRVIWGGIRRTNPTLHVPEVSYRYTSVPLYFRRGVWGLGRVSVFYSPGCYTPQAHIDGRAARLGVCFQRQPQSAGLSPNRSVFFS